MVIIFIYLNERTTKSLVPEPHVEAQPLGTDIKAPPKPDSEI